MSTDNKLIFAIPKGRILEELMPLLQACDIRPEDDFFNDKSRKLRFTTNLPDLDIIRVRAFDVATMVAMAARSWALWVQTCWKNLITRIYIRRWI